MASIGSYTLIKNEIAWIRPHLYSWLPWLDHMVFFDGNSTDGTLETLKEIRASHPFGNRITIVEAKDPSNLQEDYVRLFNEAMQLVDADYCSFLHPDFILDDPGDIKTIGDNIAYTFNIRSFGGDPGGQLYEITKGRSSTWKHIQRKRNPDLGLHYFGFYGAQNEDCYFKKITGDAHQFNGTNYEKYPYEVGHTTMKVSHFSDVRPYERRISRMISCLLNQGYTPTFAEKLAKIHPRVTFKHDVEAMEAVGFKFNQGFEFEFEAIETPEYLKQQEPLNV